MFLCFDIGAASVKAVLPDSDDRVVAIAAADLPGQMRAATFAASHARWRRIAPFAKEIRQ
jgi:sugar (pentulose or hexulose) kinase